ncbi:PREDICTED: ermin isoform X2 [Miniopterus natalensis]|uniref:ermin isoform X2 n=1 Tax=Miniopterus natalensis TaxID=291302 RepID=UPI0007A6E405|nr:PREDICTED: ermin isoform X2 [Miniopterus natalensis]
MTDVPVTFSQVECNGDTPPENGNRPITKTNEVSDVDGTPPHYRVEPGLEGLPTEGNQEKSEKLQGKMLLNWSKDEKILKETSVDEMTFREGHQWKKIPRSSSQEASAQKDELAGQPLGERGGEGRKHTVYQATAIEWLGFRKPRQVPVLHHEEEGVWDEETNNEDDDEDEVRVIEFRGKNEEGSRIKEEGDPSEDSPLSSPSSQPVTPDEQPALGKKGDISRNAYSRYNTISYRKIRKGNTKQRIDEFESMLHL